MDYPTLIVVSDDGNVVTVDESKLIDDEKVDIETLVDVRDSGTLKGKAMWLSSKYDWVIGKDGEGLVVLVPTVRKG